MASGHEIQVDTTLDRRETSTQTSGECHDSLNRLTVTIHRALVQKSFHEAGGQCSYSKKATSRTNICRLMANFSVMWMGRTAFHLLIYDRSIHSQDNILG